MRQLLHIAGFEYRRNVFKRGFLFVLLGLPLTILLLFVLFVVVMLSFSNDLPVGFIDRAGLSEALLSMPENPGLVELIPFQTETDARMALEEGLIQAYLSLPPDYPHNHRAKLIYKKWSSTIMFNQQLDDFLRVYLMSGKPPEITRRVLEGTQIVPVSLDAQGVHERQRDLLLEKVLSNPSLIIYLLLSLISGYLVQAVADEKENRTIEILITSVKIEKLLTGKLLGIFGVLSTLLIFWGSPLIPVFMVLSKTGDFLGKGFTLDWGVIWIVMALAILTCVALAAVMTGIGALVEYKEDGLTFASLLLSLLILPVMFIAISEDAFSGPLGLIMSMAPFTALYAVNWRLLYGSIPGWQLALIIVLQILYAWVSVILSGRFVRWGMLRYGHYPMLKGLWEALRAAR